MLNHFFSLCLLVSSVYCYASVFEIQNLAWQAHALYEQGDLSYDEFVLLLESLDDIESNCELLSTYFELDVLCESDKNLKNKIALRTHQNPETNEFSGHQSDIQLSYQNVQFNSIAKLDSMEIYSRSLALKTTQLQLILGNYHPAKSWMPHSPRHSYETRRTISNTWIIPESSQLNGGFIGYQFKPFNLSAYASYKESNPDSLFQKEILLGLYSRYQTKSFGGGLGFYTNPMDSLKKVYPGIDFWVSNHRLYLIMSSPRNYHIQFVQKVADSNFSSNFNLNYSTVDYHNPYDLLAGFKRTPNTTNQSIQAGSQFQLLTSQKLNLNSFMFHQKFLYRQTQDSILLLSYKAEPAVKLLPVLTTYSSLINSDIKKSTTNFSYEYGVRYEPKGYTFQTSLKKMQKYYTGDSHYPLKLIISRNLREDLHNKLSFTSPRLDFRDKYIQIRSQNQMGFKRGRFSQVFNLAWNQHLNGRLSSPGLYTGVSLRF